MDAELFDMVSNPPTLRLPEMVSLPVLVTLVV